MKRFLVMTNLLINLVAGVLSGKEEATPSKTVAQELAELRLEVELAEAMEEIALDNLEAVHNITWLDQDTGLYELVIEFESHTIGVDGIFDINKYGECDDMNVFRYFIDNESYIDYNRDIWEENIESLCPELTDVIF